MKTLLSTLTLCCAAVLSTAAQPASPGRPAAPPLTEAYSVIERGPHHRVWARLTLQTNAQGIVTARTNSYTELCTGLHRLENGQWVETTPELAAEGGEVIGRGAAHEAHFAANLNSRAAIQIKMSDGQWLKTHILGLSYHDVASGSNVLIAEIKDCAPQLLGTNQVLYADAFTDFAADVRYTYSRSGVEQDVILRAQPPRPEEWGLNPATTHLLVFSEVVDSPTPRTHERSGAAGRSGLRDQTIDFGSMRMVPGRAFELNSANPRRDILVAKQYEVIGDRKFVVERVPYRRIKAELLKLPPAEAPANAPTGTSTNGSLRKLTRWFAQGSLPLAPKSLKTAQTKAGPVPHTAALVGRPGFVMDWVVVSGGWDWSFWCYNTYLVGGEVHLFNPYFEPGVVIKYTPGSSLYVDGPLYWSETSSCGGDAALLTSMNDDEHGERIDGSSGMPDDEYGPALVVSPEDLPTAQAHIGVLYAYVGIVDNGLPTVAVNVGSSLGTKSPVRDCSFTITRSGGNLGRPLTVLLPWSGTAQPGLDYNYPPSTVVIPAFWDSVDITITPTTQQTLYEGSVVLDLLAYPEYDDYEVGSPCTATATIRDSRLPVAPLTALPWLVAFWRAEDNTIEEVHGASGTWQDEENYDNGEVGRAFRFSGSQNAVALASAAGLQLQNFTIEGWIQRGSLSSVSGQAGDSAFFFSFGSGGYGFGLDSTGRPLLAKIDTDSVSPNVAITDMNWHHVAVVKCGTAAMFYVDGVAYGAGNYSSSFSFSTTPAIGARGDTLANSFLGLVDELSIYNVCLQQYQIQSIVNAGPRGKAIAPSILPYRPPPQPQPAIRSVVQGNTTIFSVTAAGTGPFSYFWSRDGQFIPGATSSSYVINNVQPANAGTYAVAVYNAVGSVVSPGEVLTVISPLPVQRAPSGLVAWWPADCNTTEMLSGGSGALHNAVTFVDGKVGEAFHFDGVSSGVAIGNPANLQLQDFTIEGWIQRSSTTLATSIPGHDGVFFSFGSGGYGFGLSSSGHPLLSKIDIDEVEPTVAITDLNWHHVAVTKNGTTVIFYIDGIPYSVPSYNGSFSFSTPAAIGARGDTFGNSFLGAVDELSIYNRPLSENEISLIYKADLNGKIFPPYITTQPASQTVNQGANATFSVAAAGVFPLSYQWRFNGKDISGAATSSLTLNSVQLAQAGTYSVLIATPHGVLLSADAVLQVRPPDDSDGDFMSDAWEIQHFGDLQKTGAADSDLDGLTDLQEYQYGTDPQDTDSNNNGINDYLEYIQGRRPGAPGTVSDDGTIQLKVYTRLE